MTHDDRISSYIDNEFSAEQEQEFLISLAASEGLRKSFRSELVLKKVLHHDEAAMNPPRKLRGAVFASLGLGAAGLSVNKANATQSVASHGILQTLFATKMSTLITVAGLSISALAGYGVHSVVNPAVPLVQPVSRVIQPVTPAFQQAPTTVAVPEISPAPVEPEVKQAVSKPVTHVKPDHIANSTTTTTPAPVNGTAGGGPVSIEPPKINPAH